MGRCDGMQFGRWRESIVEVLVGASAAVLAFAAIDATTEPVLGAIALVGIALMFAGEIGPQPLPQAAPGFDATIADAMSG
jgi:hypothetical protein